MNPPFALKSGDDKEYKFIDYALTQMQDGGILFSVLPLSVLIERSTLTWRRDILLRNNTLISVVTFPEDLFYPIGVYTVGIFIKKGIPHPENQNVLWIRALNDGYLKKKGKRLESEGAVNDLPNVLPILQNFVINQDIAIDNIPEFQKTSPINFNDTSLELVPEAYLDQRILTHEELERGMDSLIRETASFIINSGMEDDF